MTVSRAQVEPPRSSFPYPRKLSDDGNNTVRLSILFPGTWEDFICCELQYVSLNEAPEYEAVSYRWGTGDVKTKIICGGIPATVPLDHYLRLLHGRRGHCLRLSSVARKPQNRRCQDSRDKVYALLGLSEVIEGKGHNIVPDSGWQTTGIYEQVAKSVLEKSSTLDLLGIPKVMPPSPIGVFPSWVPDWSSWDFASSLCLRNMQGEYFFSLMRPKLLPSRSAW